MFVLDSRVRARRGRCHGVANTASSFEFEAPHSLIGTFFTRLGKHGTSIAGGGGERMFA